MHVRSNRRSWGMILTALLALSTVTLHGAEPIAYEQGNKLELFVDARQIASQRDVELRLHEPREAEVALRFDVPWEGKYSAYVTVFRDNDRVRMVYRGWPELGAKEKGVSFACLAESRDGRLFERPLLGLFEFQGSKQNNIIWGDPSHNFTPFKDSRPGVSSDQLYKALNSYKSPSGAKGLAAYASADGIHWRLLSDEPVLTKGAFDSQNLAFWDPNLNVYRCYYRIFTNKVRAVAVATSTDFLNWSDPTPVDLGEAVEEHFYTNATAPYFRAPHFYFMFPKRYAKERHRLENHKDRGISDAVFLSSRDGIHFDRTFHEAFIRPGRDQLNWGDRSTMTAWGIVQTADDEMSIYYSQHYRYPSAHMRRGVLRLDGIASAHAGAKPGELITKPLRFTGKQLVLNYATSAAGSVRVEVQDEQGLPLKGYTLDDATELYGDQIAEAYRWKNGTDLSALAGRVVRLRFVLRDADVYSYKFE